MQRLTHATSERQFLMYEALRRGADVQALYEKTYIKPWFIQQMKELVELEEEILQHRGGLPPRRPAGAGQAGRVSRIGTWRSCSA